MDLYVEHQAISQVLAGDLKKFILLYEANFEDLYRYVYRRVGDPQKIEEIVRFTFVDALARNDEISRDLRFNVWLYALAKKRIWKYYQAVNFKVDEVIDVDEELINQEQAEMVKTLEKTLLKLSLEEREIIRLKFFEDLADVDVSEVLDAKKEVSTTQIYRVMKRFHFLLYGDTNQGQAVYFAQLSGLISKVRDWELIEIPQALFVSLRVDLMARIERQDFRMNEAEHAEIKPVEEKENLGSNDPAKVFVEAVKEMREEDYEDFETREKIIDVLDRFKPVLLIFPALILFYFLYLGWNLAFGPIDIDETPAVYAEKCEVDVKFEDDFSEEEKKEIGKKIANRLCDYFPETRLEFNRVSSAKIEVDIDSDRWQMQYGFEKDSRAKKWKIKRYARIAYRN